MTKLPAQYEQLDEKTILHTQSKMQGTIVNRQDNGNVKVQFPGMPASITVTKEQLKPSPPSLAFPIAGLRVEEFRPGLGPPPIDPSWPQPKPGEWYTEWWDRTFKQLTDLLMAIYDIDRGSAMRLINRLLHLFHMLNPWFPVQNLPWPWIPKEWPTEPYYPEEGQPWRPATPPRR